MSEIFMNDEIISLPANSRKIQKNSLRPEQGKNNVKYGLRVKARILMQKIGVSSAAESQK